MSKRILCAIDGTEHAATAIGQAARLASATGAELIILAVNELSGAYGHGGASTYIWQEADLNKILDTAKVAAVKAGVANPKMVSVGSRDVARVIAVYAEDNHCDHIVVGTGGKSTVTRLMLGSVSRDVVFRSHCSVTVAR